MAVSTPKIDEIRARLLKMKIMDFWVHAEDSPVARGPATVAEARVDQHTLLRPRAGPGAATEIP